MSGVEASTLFALASVSSSVGTVANIQSQRAAMARENYRIETERRMARLRALEEENAREEMLQNALANNLAYQSIAGFSDDSRSFLNINNVAIKKAEKDIANIRLMGKNINNKYTSMIAENKYKEQGYEIVRVGGEASIPDMNDSIQAIGYAMAKADGHIGIDSGFLHMANLYHKPEDIHLYTTGGYISHHFVRAKARGVKIYNA